MNLNTMFLSGYQYSRLVDKGIHKQKSSEIRAIFAYNTDTIMKAFNPGEDTDEC